MDYYNILGINKNASQEEIKKAFRKKSMETHPDRGGNEEEFRKVSEAYDILSDNDKRSEYDRFGTVEDGKKRFQSHGFSMDDIFSQFSDIFGGNRHQDYNIRKGQDLRVNVSVTLEDILNGCTKKIKYKRQSPCKPCNGKGGTDPKECPTCKGTGQRVIVQQTPFGIIQQSQPCFDCNYTGKKITNKCKSCNGLGTTLNEEILDINIPAGIFDGSTLKMNGYGNHIIDGIPGDLRIFISEVKHDKFKRDGNNLYTDIWISIPSAVLGTKVEIQTLKENISIDIDPGCESGKIFTFYGKGIPQINTNFIGNLYVKVNVTIPKNITDKEFKIYKELQNNEVRA